MRTLLVLALATVALASPVDIVPRISGGGIAGVWQFKYQVGIYAEVPQGDRICSGAILNDHWVITAASCLENARVVNMALGAENILNTSEYGHVEYNIYPEHMFFHPEWNNKTGANNLALMVVPKFHTIRFQESIQPVDLPHLSQVSETFEGYIGTITGWGRHSDEQQDDTMNLRYISLLVISNAECKKHLALSISDANMCVSSDHGKSLCPGDSGDPIVITDKDGKSTLIGIASSFGLQSACKTGSPSVFMRITSYLDWISKTSGIQINP